MIKKFFLWTLSLVALSFIMVSCGEGNNPAHLKNFKVDMKVYEHSIDVTITSADKETYFYFDVLEAEEFAKLQPEDLMQKLKDQVGSQPFGSQLSKAEETWEFPNLESGTDYILYLFRLNENYEMVGELEYQGFTTKGVKPVTKTTEHFILTVSDLTPRSAHLEVEAKDKEALFVAEGLPKTLFDQMAAEIKKMEPTEEFVYQGSFDAGTGDMLTPNTEYVFFAALVGEKDGKLAITGDLEYLTFKTPDVEMTNTVNLALTGKVAYNGEAGMFQALAGGSEKDMIGLLVKSESLTGNFTEKDFFTGGSAQSGIYENGKEYPFFRANFSGKQTDETTYTYSGTFDCVNGTRYKLTMVCKVELL